MAYPWSAGDQLNAADLNAIAQTLVKTFTAGGTINASSTPKAVYLKASDGKVYVADASADESTYKFLGWVGGAQSVTAGQTVVVTIQGFLAGFTGLTQNAYYYLNSAGAVSTTPDTTRPKRVAFAVSTTAIIIVFGQNIRTFSTSGSGTVTVTNTIAVGFRAKYITGVCEGGNGGGSTGTSSFFSTNELSQQCLISRGHVTPGTYTDRIGAESNVTPTDFLITIGNYTDTGFDVVFNLSSPTCGGSVQGIAYGE